ncbi:phosphotransferase [Sediminibacillus halophilus]|uniref:Phosphotransferase enzyme family protein n=1 Tax=Sediminibacillus halophilus TaxID=482461 RepID=A0A1G9XRI6_9BACI|nr:phosphotransferase [Sediminibacillus halophilus]SDM99026.1 Phosphotransferase enzyme family protein [Sediminibacillus halophilus]
MNKLALRDEAFQARLSSFLQTKAHLCPEKLRYLKHAVFVLRDNCGQEYILKGIKQRASVQQQLDFQVAYPDPNIVRFVHFPNGELFLYEYGYYWLLMPYREGLSLQFANKQDREMAVEVLRNFHLAARGINVADPVIRSPLVYKWEKRLHRFSKTRFLFEAAGKDSLAREIIDTTASLLERLRKDIDWYTMEKTAVDRRSWTHGDVASHNFLRTNSGTVNVIDFDLLSMAPESYDWIQLGQRFLPYVNHDIKQLCSHLFLKKEEEIEFILRSVATPVDLIREWLLFSRRKRSWKQLSEYVSNLEEKWKQRVKFVKDVEIVLT